ncbi:hypothetical protein BC829DRAFT_401143 [Chytridium lagenaria]|nr:hypothetical protein BC829DRAFT_401143 [Chytridium lagenaria]
MLFAFATLASTVDARFQQEQLVQLGQKVQASGCRKSPGDNALGFGGQEISLLLAAASPCAKLKMADDLIEAAKKECENDGPAFKKIIDAAMDLVAAERNFNPVNADARDTICTDPAFPSNPILRGIVPKVDPRTAAPGSNNQNFVQGAQTVNRIGADILTAAKAAGRGPGAAADVSVADLVFVSFLPYFHFVEGSPADLLYFF